MAARFSIVIPTHNRAALLRHAIASALGQTRDDLEVVVSLNACTDDSGQMASSFNDKRVRVVTTPRKLLMHESWQFGLDQSRGEFVTFLCDDDALHPRALEHALAAMNRTNADAVYWPRAYWIEPADGSMPTTFRFGSVYSDRLWDVDQTRLIDAAFDVRVTLNELAPWMHNSLLCRSLIERAHDNGLRFFRPSCPDCSSLLAIALTAKRLVCIDAPLAVSGLTPASTMVSAMTRGEQAREFCQALLRDVPDLVRTPVLLTVRSWIAQTCAQCAVDFAPLRHRTLNLVHLFGVARCEIEQWRTQGFGVDKLEAEWRAALAEQFSNVQRQVDAFVSKPRMIETQQFVKLIQDSEPIVGCGSAAIAGGLACEHGFRSIGEFAARLENWINDHHLTLPALHNLIQERAAGRTLVVYGLGNVGQSLVRASNASNAFDHPIHVLDDGLNDSLPGCHQVSNIGELNPNRHFVLVTPQHYRSIEDRLLRVGFMSARDYLALEAALQHAVPETVTAN